MERVVVEVSQCFVVYAIVAGSGVARKLGQGVVKVLDGERGVEGGIGGP